jgi:alanine dehydrogenase
VRRGKVVVLGGGVVGTNAARIAIGIGADVVVLDIAQRRLSYLAEIFGHTLQTLYCSRANLHETLKECDLLIGAVLIPGATTPRLVKREDLALMKPGAVIVDVAIDQGGCIETSHPTTHDDPTYVVDGVVHYAVANMPGAVALTSTMALTNHTLEYALQLADLGFEKAVATNLALRRGVNLHAGRVTHPGVAESFGMPCTPLPGA